MDTIDGETIVKVTIKTSDGRILNGYINKDKHGRFYPSKNHSYHFKSDRDSDAKTKALKAVNEVIKYSEKFKDYIVLDYTLEH